jgi:hypothetical protein
MIVAWGLFVGKYNPFSQDELRDEAGYDPTILPSYRLNFKATSKRYEIEVITDRLYAHQNINPMIY